MIKLKEVNLGDLCKDIAYGYTTSATFENIGPKFLRITDIVPDRINWDLVPNCIADKETLDKYRLENGDIVIARTGATTGYNKIIKNLDFDAIFASYLIRFKIDDNIAHPQFIGYVLQSSRWYEYIDAIAGGSAQPGANAKELASYRIILPPLDEQKAIASVLSSIDDKIDLLHRQNKTLEEMAETLFRQWFVEQADEKWENVKIGNLVNINALTIDKNTKLKRIRYLDTGSLIEGKVEKYQLFNISDAPIRARRIVKHNDILISTVRPNQKHYGILKHPKEDIVVSTGFCVITCNKINPHFIYILLTTQEMTEYLHSIAEGSTSTYPSLKPSDIEKLEFQMPPTSKLNAFSEFADSIWNKIDQNFTQICTLEKLRNILLPKLMSGEARILL